MEYATSRPRVLGWVRSAAILDGDWGTSIAYVLGLGFALAGYSSFWHLMMMLGLTALVAVNYITICHLYPNGGGVYSSVVHRSKRLAVIGALLLAADYIITMALSILDACHYLGLNHPAAWATLVILLVATLNWYGPKHSGGLAFVISAVTLTTLVAIIIASAPTSIASARIQEPTGGIVHNWGIFVGVILSLSGIEAISNMTGLMKEPKRDSRNAILSVLIKVVITNVFLTLAMHSIVGLLPGDHRDDMLRFLGEHFVGPWFGWVVAIAMGTLLISAGNTALNDLISIQFLMAVDKELPRGLRKLNRFGVPVIPLVLTAAAPIIVLTFIHDVETLSHLYAIGLVGAIVINLGSTATDKTIELRKHTRIFMLVSASILLLIEASIAVRKPEATLFASIVLVVGLGARQVAKRKVVLPPVPEFVPAFAPVSPRRRGRKMMPTAKFLVALKEANERLLKFAIDEAKTRNALLFVLRVKEIAVGALPEKLEMSTNGFERRTEELCAVAGIDYQLISIPSYEVGYTIVEQAATYGVDRVIVGAPSRNLVENVLKGSTVRSIGSLLPDEIQLIVYGG